MNYTQLYCAYTEAGVDHELARRAAWAKSAQAMGITVSFEQLSDINAADLITWSNSND